ncbi:hypothetical protein EAJ14_01985 [Parabacteroides distasonis]|uniref:Uncharacterized protein n=1 Tax=Parabacteroides distasonis TaxID=823 RepID=A0A6I2MVW8_PARDI|nr:hypothetical protein F9952_11245 [Bacteroides stercoris]MCB6684596.1 KxYKxGKxW signal peptide domain-containing protein [Alistipes finegoldii]MCE8770640.1 KxYKxGKxW signal peptide domain-containing protein [Bacteroides caccae]MRY06162.1 hypothetical protein [Parabacteroides distasonis]HCY32937.1 hypothetical protein [Bacteroides thetaiotaomicron]
MDNRSYNLSWKSGKHWLTSLVTSIIAYRLICPIQ